MIDYLKYAGLLIILILLQKLIDWLLPVTAFGITPDIVLIGLVYVAIREGKIYGSIGGFILGLIMDIISFSFIGLSALSKASAGFFAGFFNDENKTDKYLTSSIFLIIVFFASILNNSIYYIIYFQGTNFSILDIFLKYVLTTSIYTTFVSFFVIVVERKKLIRI